jgi:type II secretory pathway pseudopilin PulG
MTFNSYKKINLAGALLLELLVVIGVFAILVPIVAQIIIVSLNVNKVSIENAIALNLIDEVISATENTAFSSWNDIYNLTKNTSAHYYPLMSLGAWTVASGDEVVNVNGNNYTRYFTVSNVCRDASNNIINDSNVPPCVGGLGDDPSVQRIIITVNWNDRTISKNTYVMRWHNQACYQTDWTGTGAGPLACPSTLYDSATSMDVSSSQGSLKLQAN